MSGAPSSSDFSDRAALVKSTPPPSGLATPTGRAELSRSAPSSLLADALLHNATSDIFSGSKSHSNGTQSARGSPGETDSDSSSVALDDLETPDLDHDKLRLTGEHFKVEDTLYCGGKVSGDTLKLVYLALCFMILLASFSTCLSLVGPIFQHVGILSLCLQNFGFAIGSLFAPTITAKIGIRATMVLAAFMYTGFIALVQLNLTWLFLSSSAVRGFSGGALWNAQAVYLARVSERHPGQLGRLSGLFYGIYSFEVLVGNLIVGVPLLLQTSVPTQSPLEEARTTLWILIAIGTLATFMFIFVRPVEPVVPEKPEPFMSHMRGTFGLFRNRTMKFLLVWTFMFGFVICFMWGPVAMLFNNVKLNPTLFVTFGLPYIIASPVTGKIYDSYGWKALLIMYSVLHVIAYAVFIYAYERNVFILFYVAALVFGWIEAELGTLNEASFIRAFSDQPGHAFALANFVQSFGQVFGYLVAAYFDYWVVLICNVVLLIVGTATYAIALDPNVHEQEAVQHVASPKPQQRR